MATKKHKCNNQSEHDSKHNHLPRFDSVLLKMLLLFHTKCFAHFAKIKNTLHSKSNTKSIVPLLKGHCETCRRKKQKQAPAFVNMTQQHIRHCGDKKCCCHNTGLLSHLYFFWTDIAGAGDILIFFF